MDIHAVPLQRSVATACSQESQLQEEWARRIDQIGQLVSFSLSLLSLSCLLSSLALLLKSCTHSPASHLFSSCTSDLSVSCVVRVTPASFCPLVLTTFSLFSLFSLSLHLFSLLCSISLYTHCSPIHFVWWKMEGERDSLQNGRQQEQSCEKKADSRNA